MAVLLCTRWRTTGAIPGFDGLVDHKLCWTASADGVDDLTEQTFELSGTAGPVPGVLWSPTPRSQPCSLVLLGHGGSGHKRSHGTRRLARRLSASTGAAVVAIDGPYHGDRVPAPMAPTAYQAQMDFDGVETVVDQMVRDWTATVEAMVALEGLGRGRLAYVGLSMGTRFGLPLAAAMGPELCCVVLGKFGLDPAPTMPRGLAMTERLTRDASHVTAPVLFHLQWDDRLFPRDGQLKLFDLLGSEDKRLLGYSGGHGVTHDSAIDAWCAFTAEHMVTLP